MYFVNYSEEIFEIKVKFLEKNIVQIIDILSLNPLYHFSFDIGYKLKLKNNIDFSKPISEQIFGNKIIQFNYGTFWYELDEITFEYFDLLL